MTGFGNTAISSFNKLATNFTADTFSIYRSSAGSGKTYQLAVEHISLALQDPSLFNKILAVTFTNKATREMKDRILSFLARLANEEDEELAEQVRLRTGLTKEQISINSQKVLERILHQYSQFSVSTIDAFFQKIVKSFAKELGLLGNYKIELDQDKIKNEVIDQMLEALDKDTRMTSWLIDFALSKVDEHRSWNIRPDIEKLANELFKESFRNVESDLSLVGADDLKPFLNKLVAARQTFELHMQYTAREALRLIQNHGLTIEDFAYKSSGPAGYFVAVLERRDFKPGERILQALEDNEKWSTKSSPLKNEILSLANDHLNELSGNLVAYYQEHIRAYTSVNEVLKNFYVYGILSDIQKKLKDYRRENDVMLISDIPIFLNGIIAENDAPFIYEKTGAWFQHYLMDEFQDTSGFQWQNFRPLIVNGLSQGNMSMLVGDGKQSIYRWRGGDWNLILHKVKKDLMVDVVEKFLDTNWRSAADIIKFNNAFFKSAPEKVRFEIDAKINKSDLSEQERAALSLSAEDVTNLYADVEQKPGPKAANSRGKVVLHLYQKNEDVRWKEEVLNRLSRQIEELQDYGYEPKDIAVLVRRSEEGRQVIEHLVRYKNSPEANQAYSYNAISNESLFLQNSTAVRIIINAIKYLLNRQDQIALAELSYHYHCLHNDTNVSSLDHDDWSKEDFLPAEFTNSIDSMLRLPAYELFERIIQLLQLVRAEDKEYLQAFQDTVLEFFSSEERDLHDFIQWWEEQGKRTSIRVPGSENAISVLTIHKSKGLEFKAVLIPYCDWKLDHDSSKQNILWCKSDQKLFDQIGYLPLKYSSSLGDSYFARDYFEEMIRAHIDNLNLLYVALTRAEEFLMVNCPPFQNKINTSGDLISSWVSKMEQEHHQVELRRDAEDAFVTSYSLGSVSDKKPLLTKNVIPGVESPYISDDWRSKIWIKKNAASLIKEKPWKKKSSISYGLIVHEILAAIRHIDQLDNEIDSYFREGRISQEDKKNLLKQLDILFSNPQVRSWFETDRAVKTEIPILVHNEQPRRPDRVILGDDEAIIVDFKTGNERPAHKKQVLEYQRLLIEMGYRNVQAYLLYISSKTVIQVA